MLSDFELYPRWVPLMFSSLDLASVKCHAFLRPTQKRAAAPWGVGARDG